MTHSVKRSGAMSPSVFLVFAILLLTLSGVARARVLGAQASDAVDSRFQPWIGCWRTSGGTSQSSLGAGPTMACVVPSRKVTGSVDVLLYSGDSLLSTNSLPRPGATAEMSVDDCRGQERADWTADNVRFILAAELICAGGMKRAETGLMTITPEGQWLQIQHLKVGSNEATTTARFIYDASDFKPEEISFGTKRSSAPLRLVAGAPANLEQVLDVASRVPSALAEVWLAELELSFKVDGRLLASLADRGMPLGVIDMIVATSNPRVFSARPATATVQRGEPSSAIGAVPTQTTIVINSRSQCGMWGDFCYGPGGMGAWGFGWPYGYRSLDPWARYYDPFLRFGYPYSDPYGGGVYMGGRPVIIVGQPAQSVAPPGRAIKGEGYTRQGGAGSPDPRPNPTGSAPSKGASGGSGGGGGGAASEKPSTGTGRTAKPRPPGGG